MFFFMTLEGKKLKSKLFGIVRCSTCFLKNFLGQAHILFFFIQWLGIASIVFSSVKSTIDHIHKTKIGNYLKFEKKIDV